MPYFKTVHRDRDAVLAALGVTDIPLRCANQACAARLPYRRGRPTPYCDIACKEQAAEIRAAIASAITALHASWPPVRTDRQFRDSITRHLQQLQAQCEHSDPHTEPENDPYKDEPRQQVPVDPRAEIEAMRALQYAYDENPGGMTAFDLNYPGVSDQIRQQDWEDERDKQVHEAHLAMKDLRSLVKGARHRIKSLEEPPGYLVRLIAGSQRLIDTCAELAELLS